MKINIKYDNNHVIEKINLKLLDQIKMFIIGFENLSIVKEITNKQKKDGFKIMYFEKEENTKTNQWNIHFSREKSFYSKNVEKILVIDIETTGKTPCNNRILQLSALLVDPKYNVLKEFNSYIYENNVNIQHLHFMGLTREEYNNIAEVKDVVTNNWINFLKEIDFDIVLGYNIRDYTIPFLNKSDIWNDDITNRSYIYDSFKESKHRLLNLENHLMENIISNFNWNGIHGNMNNAYSDCWYQLQLFNKLENNTIEPIRNFEAYQISLKYNINFNKNISSKLENNLKKSYAEKNYFSLFEIYKNLQFITKKDFSKLMDAKSISPVNTMLKNVKNSHKDEWDQFQKNKFENFEKELIHFQELYDNLKNNKNIYNFDLLVIEKKIEILKDKIINK